MHELKNKTFYFRDGNVRTAKIKQHLKTALIHFVLPVSLGSLIYLLFRSKHLLIFHWFNALGLYPAILAARQHIIIFEQTPSWLIYSLPNGLWAYSFMFFISYIWSGTKAPARYLFIFMVLTLSLGSEIGQLLGTIPGTFCFEDLIVYVLGLSLGFYFGNKMPKEVIKIE